MIAAAGFAQGPLPVHQPPDEPSFPGPRRPCCGGAATATKEELIGIGRAMDRVVNGGFDTASDFKRIRNEFERMGESPLKPVCT